MKNYKCLVIDNSYMARSIITSNRAFAIVYKGNAEVVNEHDVYFKLGRNNPLKIKKPSIIRVFKYVNQPFHKVKLSKDNIFKRDNYRCVYCGSKNKKTLTLDHVLPRSKGGKNSWENLVTACKKCNGEKDSLLLKEWGKEIPKPYRPHYLMLIKDMPSLPKEWEPFLFLN